MSESHPRAGLPWEPWEDRTLRAVLMGDEWDRAIQLVRVLDELQRPEAEVAERARKLFNWPGLA